MNDSFILSVAREALWIVLLVSAPILGVSLLIGLIISIFQATTQIQEQTLSFVPKVIAIGAALLIFGPWILHTLLQFSEKILGNLEHFTFIR